VRALTPSYNKRCPGVLALDSCMSFARLDHQFVRARTSVRVRRSEKLFCSERQLLATPNIVLMRRNPQDGGYCRDRLRGERWREGAREQPPMSDRPSNLILCLPACSKSLLAVCLRPTDRTEQLVVIISFWIFMSM
jgi:hypothetical protein